MFVWDVSKALTNFQKHEVSFEEAATSFEEAATSFEDQFGLEVDDVRHSKSESRFARFAESASQRVLTVIFTVRRLTNGEEAIRIISARRASRKERENYYRFRHRLQ